MLPFESRSEAGKFLAQRLSNYSSELPVVLALPRGGLPIAAEIADFLKAPLDILFVKKIGAPSRPELAIGAVAEGEITIWNKNAQSLPQQDLTVLAKQKRIELRAQMKKFRHVKNAEEVRSRTVILVDDGLATGATMEAAIAVLKKKEPFKIVVAIPVSSSNSFHRIRSMVDEIVALIIPKDFFSIGTWYKDFSEVSDEEALNSIRTRFSSAENVSKDVTIKAGKNFIHGDFFLPPSALGVIVFAHGSGSSRLSPRNKFVAKALQENGFATFLIDLLTEAEAQERKNVFDISFLASRLLLAKEWLNINHPELSLGYFGASTGAAAVLAAVAMDEKNVFAIVSRGGRPDLAYESLPVVTVPTLLLVGGDDGPIIPLNRAASDRLARGRLVIIPGAGHTFEEPGKLREVIEFAGDWFREHLPAHSQNFTEPMEQTVREILRLAKPIKKEKCLEELAQKIAQSRIVMLGEATHGTKEFFEVRRSLSQILIEEHGFQFVAIQGDWPVCYEINSYVRERKQIPKAKLLEKFERWPTWLWNNEEVKSLIEWMRGRHVGFYGLDIFSLFESLSVIKRNLSSFGVERGSEILRRYRSIERFSADEKAYAKSLMQDSKDCEQEILDNLNEILAVNVTETSFNEEQLFNVRQNALVVFNSQRYYKAMLSNVTDSWNIRERHMLESLKVLLNHYGPKSKAIVWAHNNHVGDYRSSAMLSQGKVSFGGLAKEEFGKEVSLVGLGTNGGTVRAANAWGARDEVMLLPSAKNDSLEYLLHEASRHLRHDRFYLIFDQKALGGPLARRHNHRAVGVVYQPSLEAAGQTYTLVDLSRHFDAFVYLDRTSALGSLYSGGLVRQVPETWPSGF